MNSIFFLIFTSKKYNITLLIICITEKPITNLEQLADAMENQGYQLLVEKLSPSHGNVEVLKFLERYFAQ